MNKLDEKEIFAGQKFTCKVLRHEEMNFENGFTGTTLFYQIYNQTNKTLNLQINEKYLITKKGEQRDEDSHLTGYIFEGGKIIAKSHKIGSSIFYSTTCGKIVQGCKYALSIEDENNDGVYSLIFEYDGYEWQLVDFNIDSEEDDHEVNVMTNTNKTDSSKLIDTKLLVKNTDVIETTFSNCNLQVVGIGYTVKSFSFNTNLEVTILNGSKLENDVDLKVNFYDDDNSIVCSSSCSIYKEDFTGYDTFIIESSDNDYYKTKSLLKKIRKARVFAKINNGE